MKKYLINFINKFFSFFNLKLVTFETYSYLSKLPRSFFLYTAFNQRQKEKVIKYLDKSKSQLGQDIFVVANSDNKKENFFIEFGATDGLTISNTYLLEKEFNWKGILIEPASIWHQNLEKNRNCIIDKRCIYSKSGEKISFLVVQNNQKAEPGLSSLEEYAANGDWSSNLRLKNSKKEIVETITLDDLLDFYNAPRFIDYMSVDTEGSEFDILKSIDFKKRKIKIITVEHNYHKNRGKINNLLEKNGYLRVYKDFSKFDDWYILKDS